MSDFEADRLKNEKPEPVESASPRFLYVPIILISAFVGFGTTYLAFMTRNTDVAVGDGRMSGAATTPAPAPAPADSAKGQQVFAAVCQACHQATGLGIPGAFPPLAGSEWVTGPAERVSAIVLHGLQGEITVKGTKFRGAMPAHKDRLSDEEIAAVTTYVRSAWGNSAPPIPAATVKTVRERTKARSTSWNGEADLNGRKWE